ncbi:unnamed protein product [Ambrosiozyma monospora]|uniref:Unnamed protein product n=1 Tax=Ambrosiozyma monospora TaxID=43982 RepID=A0ACB5T7C9_AMBMO|nr:unnamed protein product [Ambrosiozyma monospora]
MNFTKKEILKSLSSIKSSGDMNPLTKMLESAIMTPYLTKKEEPFIINTRPEVPVGIDDSRLHDNNNFDNYVSFDSPPIKNEEQNVQSNILRVFAKTATANDFASLLPKTASSSLQKIIKSRRKTSYPDGTYLLFFENEGSAQNFLDATTGIQINNRPIQYNFISPQQPLDELVQYPYIPRHAIVKSYLEYDSWRKYAISPKTADEKPQTTEDIFSVFNKNLFSDYVTHVSCSISDSITTYLFPPIERSQVVLIRNFPDAVPWTIRDMLWDLEWYEVKEIYMNRVSTRSDGLSTFALIFKDTKNAKRCVELCNNFNWFYDPSQPIMEAELLDEDITL